MIIKNSRMNSSVPDIIYAVRISHCSDGENETKRFGRVYALRTNTRSHSRRRISIPFYSRSGGGSGGGLSAIKVRNGLSTAIRVAQTH